MQVQRISINNPTFGNNKKLNQKLIKTLTNTKTEKPFYNILYKLNSLTNEAEAVLREAEKSGDINTVQYLTSLFCNFKAHLANEVEFHFPRLQFCNKEAAAYSEEVLNLGNNNPEYWLNDVVTRLHDIDDVLNHGADVKAEEVEIEMTDEEYEAKAIEEAKNEAQREIEKIIVEYKPKGTVLKGFSALGGIKELKELLNDTVISFLKDPKMRKLDAEEYDLYLPNGFMLYGPPGCGKTAIVEHLSVEAGLPLFKINAGTYGSTFQHGGSINLKKAFDYLESIATEEKPVILLIDEADAILPQRDAYMHNHENQEMSILLQKIQESADNNIMVFLATNKFNNIDDAVKSRIEEIAYVGFPDFESRKSILELFLSRQPKAKNLLNNTEAVNKIVELLDGFSIRDMKMITKQIDFLARKEGRRDVTLQDYENKIRENQYRKIKEDLYKDFNQRKLAGFA